jgi:cell division protein FtsL
MQVSISQHAKEGVITGLNWQVLDPVGESFFGHEEIPKLIEDGNRYFVKVKNTRETNFGITKSSDIELFNNKKLYSFAAMVATHPDFKGTTCLVMVIDPHCEEPSGLAIGLVSGNIVMDLHFPLEKQHSLYEEFESLCSRAGRQFQIYGDIANVHIVPTKRITLDEICSTKSIQKRSLEALKNEKYILVFIVSILVLIALLILMSMWDWYQAEQKEILESERLHRSSPEAVYSQSVSATLAKEHLIVAAAAEDLIQAISNFPVELGGWRLMRISCEEIRCNAKWHSEGGTYDAFQRLADPAWGKLQLGSTDKDLLGDLATLSHTFELKLSKAKLPPLNEWPLAETFAFEQGIDWQKLKDYQWVGSLGPIEQQAVPSQINASSVTSHPQAIFGMRWSVTNQNWRLGQLVLPLFKSNVTLQKFELNLGEKSGEVVFSAKGIAYVKK